MQVGISRTMSSWLIYAPYFFSKNCANTETLSFADIYALRILDEGNNHSLPGTTLIGTSTLELLISPCHKYRMSDIEKTGNINIPT